MHVPNMLELLSDFKPLKALQSFTNTNETPLEDVIVGFIEPLLSAKSQIEINNYVWRCGNAIVAMAAKTPHKQQAKLVQFVLELQNQGPRRRRVTSSKLRAASFGEIYRNLAGRLVTPWVIILVPKEDGVTKEQKDRWENQNAFCARLTAKSDLSDKDRLDYSCFGLWVLREAFEDESEEQTPGYGAVRAAYMWMLYAADALWKNTKSNRKFGGLVGIGDGKHKAKGWRGFNMERWEVWKEGFAAAPNAYNATRLMEQAENNA